MLLHTQGVDGLLHLYNRLEIGGRILLPFVPISAGGALRPNRIGLLTYGLGPLLNNDGIPWWGD